MKLRTKLTLTTTVIAILAVFICTFLVITFSRQNALDGVISAGIADYEKYYSDIIKSINNSSLGDTDTLSYTCLRYLFYNTQGCDEFVLQDGDTIISNNTGIDAVKALDAHNVPEKAFPYQGIGALRQTFCNIQNQDYFIVSAHFVMGDQKFTLSLVRNITNTMDTVNNLGLKCAMAGAAVVIASALLILIFVRRSLKPVRELEKGAAEISDGNYERRIRVRGHDEIASLAERFNRMAQAICEKIAALGETAENQQAFINALSHEMKTPVTSIMARAETLLVRELSNEDKDHSLERIYNQCSWLEKLSGKLTALVMLQGNIDVKPESVRQLLAAVEETVSDALDKKDITLVTQCTLDTLPIDFDLMRAALVNLVDNAGKASSNGSLIEIRAYGNTIEVEDHGKGIPKEEVERITQPFYMVDRSRSKKNGGSGLGLTLVERIVKAHDAEMRIISTPGEGTTVKIIFSPGDVDK